MAISIKDAQARILQSGALNNLGSVNNNDLPFDSVTEEVVALWAEKSMLPAVKRSIIQKRLTASKDLFQSIAPNVALRGNNIVRFTLNMAPHWQFAEQGRKAGKRPPLKAIEQWITFKGIQVRQSKEDSKLSVLQRRRKMAKSIQMAIGRKGTIKRFGYKGSNFLSDVTPAELNTLGDILTKALGYTVMIAFKQTLQQGNKRK